MTGGSNRQSIDALVFGPLRSIRRRRFGNVLVKPSVPDLLVLKEFCETGKVRPVIARCYVEEGHARGKVVVTLF